MAILETIVPFVLLLGGLIFVHELGHFVMGKLMGVRVLTFSIGFGPTIPGLRFKRGETEYVIKMLPLGGYVRFFGDDPTEEIPEEEKRGSFNHAPLPRRFLIAFGGPLFNLLLPFLIFFPMYLLQSETTPAVLGSVYEGGPAAEAGIIPGDLITRIDDEEIADWWEMVRAIRDKAGQSIDIFVERDGEPVGPLTAVPVEQVVRSIEELDWEERHGKIEVTSAALAPIIGVDPGSKAEMAGLRNWDRIVAVKGCEREVKTWADAVRCLEQSVGRRVELVLQRSPQEIGMDPLSTTDLRARLWNPVVVEVLVESLPDGTFSGLRAADLLVATIEPDGPAAKEIGLQVGDRLVALDGEPLRSWNELSRLNEGLDDVHTIIFVPNRAGAEPVEKEFRMARHEEPTGPKYVFGAGNRMAHVHREPIPRSSRFSYALVRSYEETVEAYKITLLTVAGLFAGRVPVKELGGPILIADLARKTFEAGWERFLVLAVWLSINLGFLNLLPVPILDGGHLMFFTLEAIRRKPLSLRARQIASYFGLAVIVLLMLTAFKNDIERYWDALMGMLGFG